MNNGQKLLCVYLLLVQMCFCVLVVMFVENGDFV